MHIYSGKLNWLNEAVNERFSIVFPKNLKKGDPVCGFWRWTKDASGKKNVNQNYIGTISDVGPEENKLVLFNTKDNFYQFDAVLSENDTLLTVTMNNRNGIKAEPTTLEEVRLGTGNLAAKVGCTVYSGTLNCTYRAPSLSFEVVPKPPLSAVDEMFVLIVPASSGFKIPAVATWQWTTTPDGETNANAMRTDDAMDSAQGGTVVKFCQDESSAFDGEVQENGKALVLNMRQAGYLNVIKLQLRLAFSHG
ncbi:hypothetical protein NOR_05481 [Metarhizium rileyi]|uniref:Uncharacterized protein n=1 Tax=Metarhizium rileyi (strain RCEF 4871) TaxID=1649241 RepID=A0A162JFN0_METRR|nr:hypothetical protein NOR_05481 [Metarhizium rileyi RCEF 4871]